MKRTAFFITFILFYCANSIFAQEVLPGITVKNVNGQIIVSWTNNYKIPVSNINIQRSYDSLKNFTTIGSVLNPQNIENGYTDEKPPYNKMYYKVFVSFEGGKYLFSNIVRPVKEFVSAADGVDSLRPYLVKDNWVLSPVTESKEKNNKIQPKSNLPVLKNDNEIITYPSKRIYTNKENNIVIFLPDADTKKYEVKFFNETGLPLFEVNKLNEPHLIVEKVNFVHAGWFNFDIYENGKLIEKNKFFIAKDGKSSSHPSK